MTSGRDFEGIRDLVASGMQEMDECVPATCKAEWGARCRRALFGSCPKRVTGARAMLHCSAPPCCQHTTAPSPSLSSPLPPTSAPSLEPTGLPQSRSEDLTPIMAASKRPSSTFGQSLL